MQIKSLIAIFMLLVAITVVGTVSSLNQQNEPLSEDEAFILGIEAYIYGYPLVLMDATRKASTDAPINHFFNTWKFLDADFKEVVSPNVDTLYSSAWLDLSKEPLILHVPDSEGRYYLMPLLDAWTNVFFTTGTRTNGGESANFAIVGPDWQGNLPKELTKVQAPTNLVWIIGRIQSSGTTHDDTIVNAIQKQFSLTPLSLYGKHNSSMLPNPEKENQDKISPVELVEKMDAEAFFTKFADLLKSNYPSPDDFTMVTKLARLGIVPGQDFKLQNLDPVMIKALNRAVKAAQVEIDSYKKLIGTIVNGWELDVSKQMGNYGTNYKLRAAISKIGIGANIPVDAVYAFSHVDNLGTKLNGANRYLIHFDADQVPPVNAFWSVTLYDQDQHFFSNSLNRYSINSHSNAKFNVDGSLDIFIQSDEPKDKQGNWLPSPANQDFNLILRMYWPQESILNGEWKPTSVKRLKKNS